MKFKTGVGGVLPEGQRPGHTFSRVTWPPEELWGEPMKEEFGGAKEVVPPWTGVGWGARAWGEAGLRWVAAECRAGR